jgi:hypothetical protein
MFFNPLSKPAKLRGISLGLPLLFLPLARLRFACRRVNESQSDVCGYRHDVLRMVFEGNAFRKFMVSEV